MNLRIKNTILPAMAMILSLTACNKNDSTTTPVTPAAKIKTITKAPTGEVETYKYDSLGRIARLSTTASSSYQSYVYKGSDSIIVYTVNAAGTDSSRINSYKVNGLGLVTASASPVNTATYTYDANGYQIYDAYNSIIGTSADTFNISGGNVSEHRNGNASGILGTSYHSKQTYTYFTDKTNSVTNAAKGMSFLGKSNSNLVNSEIFHAVSSVAVPPSTTTTDETYNYTYEYGTNGWVTKLTKTALSSGTFTTETYTYY